MQVYEIIDNYKYIITSVCCAQLLILFVSSSRVMFEQGIIILI